MKIKEDERDSFKALQKAVMNATKRLSRIDPDIKSLRECVDKIQKDIIDDPMDKIKQKIKRIGKYSHLRSASFGVSVASVLLAVAIPSPITVALAGTIGGASLATLYREFISVLEKRGGGYQR
jgi:hypothetical protein